MKAELFCYSERISIATMLIINYPTKIEMNGQYCRAETGSLKNEGRG